MPIKVLMPALSPTMTEGKLSKWLKKEGDKIKSGDVIAEIETDKATIEYEATESGVLGKIIIQDGSEGIKVNELIGVLLDDGETTADIEKFLANFKPLVAGNTTVNASTNMAVEVKSAPQVITQTSSPVSVVNSSVAMVNNNAGGRVFASPLAKKIAQLSGIDIANIKGSGPNGRILKADVDNFVAGGGKTFGGASSGSMGKATGKYPRGNSGKFEDKANSGMRKTIAKRLLESKLTIPHYTETVEVLMDALLSARESINHQAGDRYKLSVNDFIIKATALAMQEIPEANAYWQGDTTRYFKSSDISIAVATPTGLITPIVFEAEAKTLPEISAEMRDLGKRAKEGKLKPSEYQGGGFSISNLGMFGIDHFTAIVNPPQAGILAVGATKEKPVVKNGQIVVANVMSITLSADHRILDGAVAAKFMVALRKYLENPVLMFYSE
jgi:pyruvate dehydrogenase E2 component (dihydrolipoamide acetyltransferase)